jgi:predicted membrane channel-forming protein YqfA (hemolysin III family)
MRELLRAALFYLTQTMGSFRKSAYFYSFSHFPIFNNRAQSQFRVSQCLSHFIHSCFYFCIVVRLLLYSFSVVKDEPCVYLSILLYLCPQLFNYYLSFSFHNTDYKQQTRAVRTALLIVEGLMSAAVESHKMFHYK